MTEQQNLTIPVLPDHAVDQETDSVMKYRVAKSTRYHYERNNISFMLWLFDNYNKYPDVLEQSLYSSMAEAEIMDRRHVARKSISSKGRIEIRSVSLINLI